LLAHAKKHRRRSHPLAGRCHGAMEKTTVHETLRTHPVSASASPTADGRCPAHPHGVYARPRGQGALQASKHLRHWLKQGQPEAVQTSAEGDMTNPMNSVPGTAVACGLDYASHGYSKLDPRTGDRG
jgi:hypothetical protein